jgi:hypothetical protein
MKLYILQLKFYNHNYNYQFNLKEGLAQRDNQNHILKERNYLLQKCILKHNGDIEKSITKKLGDFCIELNVRIKLD